MTAELPPKVINKGNADFGIFCVLADAETYFLNMKTRKVHLWVGNFESRASFEKYLDQKRYLEAWAIYDHEAPTGKEEEDAEPDPSLRCEFCRETEQDTYDEDMMIAIYYDDSVSAGTLAEDTLTDPATLKKLLDKSTLPGINAAIVYDDNQLSAESAAKSTSTRYLGKIKVAANETGNSGIHYLWVGEKEKLSTGIANMFNDKQALTKAILTETGLNKNSVIQVNVYFSDKKEKLDEMLITRVEDYNVAEKMILKADEMKLPPLANIIIDLVVNEKQKIDGAKTGTALGMGFVGKFASE